MYHTSAHASGSIPYSEYFNWDTHLQDSRRPSYTYTNVLDCSVDLYITLHFECRRFVLELLQIIEVIRLDCYMFGHHVLSLIVMFGNYGSCTCEPSRTKTPLA